MLVAFGCSSSSTNHQPEARITVADGGVLQWPQGIFTLTVPPGAVDEDVTISLDQFSSNDPINGVPDVEGIRFELKPDGLQFKVPAKVSIEVPFDSGAESASTYDLFSVSSDGEVAGLENVANEFDVAEGKVTLTGELSHFSTVVRTKRSLTVSLSGPEVAAIDVPFLGRGEVEEAETSFGYLVDWRMKADARLSLAKATPSYGPKEPNDLGAS